MTLPSAPRADCKSITAKSDLSSLDEAILRSKYAIRSEEKTLTLRVMNRAQCTEKFEALKARLSAQMEELAGLIGDCERAGIPTDYEYEALSVLGRRSSSSAVRQASSALSGLT